MTRKDFIDKLDDNYRYVIEGKNLVIHVCGNTLAFLKDIPPNIIFKNEEHVDLASLTYIPEGIQFLNKGNVYLESVLDISPDVVFKNKANIFLYSLEDLPPIEFENEGNIFLPSLRSISPEARFKNGGNAEMPSIIKRGRGWIFEFEQEIRNINSKRIFNLMIEEGLLYKGKN